MCEESTIFQYLLSCGVLEEYCADRGFERRYFFNEGYNYRRFAVCTAKTIVCRSQLK